MRRDRDTRPSLKCSEFYGLPYRREIAALRRAGFDKLTARYLMATLLCDRAGQIISEANTRAEEGEYDGVLERTAMRAAQAAEDSLVPVVAYHLRIHAGQIVDAAGKGGRRGR